MVSGEMRTSPTKNGRKKGVKWKKNAERSEARKSAESSTANDSILTRAHERGRPLTKETKIQASADAAGVKKMTKVGENASIFGNAHLLLLRSSCIVCCMPV